MWIAKNNELIILARKTREELEQALRFMVYTSIEITNVDYELYNGKYLTSDEIIKAKNQARIDEIKEELDRLDLKSIRAIRANDTEFMEKYEQEAEVLRQELKELM